MCVWGRGRGRLCINNKCLLYQLVTVVQLLTEEQLSRVCEVGVAADEVGVRADIMRLLGAVARTALSDPSTNLPLLKVRKLHLMLLRGTLRTGTTRGGCAQLTFCDLCS